MRNIFDSLTRISFSVTFLVSILLIFTVVSSVTGTLMLYTEFKRAFEFESEFILVYMTKWQPLNSITTAIWHIYYLNTWARAFVIPQKHSWLWNHFTHSSSIKLSIFIVNKPQFLQIAFSKVHCHPQLRWQVQKASIDTIWFSSILQVQLHVKFKRMSHHFLV